MLVLGGRRRRRPWRCPGSERFRVDFGVGRAEVRNRSDCEGELGRAPKKVDGCGITFELVWYCNILLFLIQCFRRSILHVYCLLSSPLFSQGDLKVAAGTAILLSQSDPFPLSFFF